MIQKVVNTFYTASKHHKLVNSFAYEIPSKIVGNGEDMYPMVVLEEPLRFSGNTNNATNSFTVNISVTTNENNAVWVNQEKCEKILYQICSYVNNYSEDTFLITNIDTLTLSRYNDDATDGVRATLEIKTNTEYNICTDEFFDETKEFDNNSPLPEINTESATGCNNLFDTKLPVF